MVETVWAGGTGFDRHFIYLGDDSDWGSDGVLF
jgi:hypothetical protein